MPKIKQINIAKHNPVLVTEVLHYLQPQAGQSYLDLTAGYGGHASAVMDAGVRPSQMTLVDRDSSAIKDLKLQFSDSGAQIIQQDFWAASQTLNNSGQKYDMILADLGVSSPHLDQPKRGFSFNSDGPLDMRMDQSQELSAETLVNSLPQADLADILRKYGEEKHSAKIAAKIVDARPITSTTHLAEVIASSSRGYSKIHPATRSFQGLRIAVNQELDQLSSSLPIWHNLLAPGGRLVVISFHSLEDRAVKQYFSDQAGGGYDSDLTLLTKKPVTANPQEIAINPRARSAKLRAVAKINKQKG